MGVAGLLLCLPSFLQTLPVGTEWVPGPFLQSSGIFIDTLLGCQRVCLVWVAFPGSGLVGEIGGKGPQVELVPITGLICVFN